MWGWRHTGWWRRIPVEFRAGIILAVVVSLIFFGAVVPLVTGGHGKPTAEVNGHFPSTITVGQRFTVPLAVDNTGDSVIGPLCLRATVDPPAVLQTVEASFQGLETIPFTRGSACAGSLSGGQVISVNLSIRGTATGSARVTLVATLHDQEVGPQLHAIVGVTAPGG